MKNTVKPTTAPSLNIDAESEYWIPEYWALLEHLKAWKGL